MWIVATFRFVRGCSHSFVLEALDEALRKNNADSKRTVLVSDIGCVGLSDRFFDVHTFHGLHGRSFTYAAGVKLARPELNVVVLVGDGGCGIGGHHLLNLARRNVGVTVLVMNNNNFGMTGGQHSVSTPHGGLTATTPAGNLEYPMDLAGLAVTAGAGFVARKIYNDQDLAETMAEAMRHEGCSVVEIMEICTSYYGPRNRYNKKAIAQYLEDNGRSTGVLIQRDRSEYAKELRTLWPETPRTTEWAAIEKSHELDFEGDEYNILLAGSAGMKVISAAANLGLAAIRCGMWVSQKDDYPITVQAGHSLSSLKISKRKINDLGVESYQAVLCLSEEGLRESRDMIEALPETALLILQDGLEVQTKAGKVVCDFKDASFRLGKANRMAAATGLLARLGGVPPIEALERTISAIKNPKVAEEVGKALEISAQLHDATVSSR